jgi:hypothetical protein
VPSKLSYAIFQGFCGAALGPASLAMGQIALAVCPIGPSGATLARLDRRRAARSAHQFVRATARLVISLLRNLITAMLEAQLGPLEVSIWMRLEN